MKPRRRSAPRKVSGVGTPGSSRGRRPSWEPFRAAERPFGNYSPHAARVLALAYPNTYHVGMSSLGFQRTFHLVHERPGWACQRFFCKERMFTYTYL